MDYKRFSEIFDGFSDIAPTLSEALIVGCNVSRERFIKIEILSTDYVPAAEIEGAIKELHNQFRPAGVAFIEKYHKDCFCVQAVKDIVARLRYKDVRLNGYFDNAQYTISEDNKRVEISLALGGLSNIMAADFPQNFSNAVKERFDLEVEVSFSGQTQDVEIPVSEAAPAPKSEKAEPAYDYKPQNGLPVYLESAKLFFGKKIDANITRICDLVPPDDPNDKKKIVVFGEVFGLETKEINSRRGPMLLAKFSFSDGTNSLRATAFVDINEKSKIKPLKDGQYILVNGDYAYDRFSGEFTVTVNSMATLVSYKKKDTYEGKKRVELHCHTNMSSKDAVSKAGDLIEQAYAWGHKAIAITDHGVVQAYPEAAAAVAGIRKKGGEFKVIYGVEAYFADDTAGETELSKLPRYHQIILVKDLVGLKNLYKLVSGAHITNFHKRPITLKSELIKHREGLIIGSACEAGELYTAIRDGKPYEELLEIAKFYDYLEIQPLGNNEFMLREAKEVKYDKKTGEELPNPFKAVTSFEVIKDFNRKVVQLGDELGLPVVATGDVHFCLEEDSIIRKILLAGQKYTDFDNQAPLYLKTTDEMLADFEYFGERAKEFVIDNPNIIADMVSGEVIPVPKGNYPPVIEGSDELLRQICWDRAMNTYGYEGVIPEVVSKRLEKELNGIISNGYSIMYISAQKLVAYSEENGYLVGSRGSVGSSFVATMAGISEVNPLAPHYYCPSCRHSIFFTKGEVGSGFDLPPKNCEKCGTPYRQDGHDIPFETFLGFKGDKVPDIDLNFSDEFQTSVQKYTETLFGSENVFKAGTITTIAEKTAFGFAKAYAEAKGIVLSNAELDRLAKKVENAGIKQTSGQHPAGMVVVPRDKEIYDFCPIQHPADDVKSDVITTHFDFHSIHDTILKLDELGHVVPTTYKYLEEYSGVPVSDISMSDEKVYSLFVSPEALGVTEDRILSKTGTFCIPEFGTKFVREMLMDCRPKNFADLLQISGLSHGTDVWLGNAKDLIDSGTCTISEVIGTRDNIMVYLIHQGMEESRAFQITETVRKGLVAKGKVSPDEWKGMEDDMRAVGVPDWYIASCHKIKYMFPKAHAAAYVIGALRLAWYKVYKPLEFYCAYFTARPEDVDVPTVLGGLSSVKHYMSTIDAKIKAKEVSKKELDVYDNMLIFNEMFERGIEVLPISLEHSHAVKYVPENGKMRLPFGALSGVGVKAAWSLYETAKSGNFISKEEFQRQAGVSSSLIEALSKLHALDSLPDTTQISIF